MGLINVFKTIFGRRKEDQYEDIDESQIPNELKALMENLKNEESMKHSSIRHKAEYDVLPHIFFNKTKLFLENINQAKEGVIQEVLSIPYREMNEESPYNIEDFKMITEKLNDEISSIKVEMPDKNIFIGNCHRIYFIFDNKLKHKQYFTIEESIGMKQLCAVDRKGKHINYGEIESESMEINKIISLI